MDEYTRACQARNGLLRKFDHGDLSSKVLIAKVSQNGSFCTLLNEKGLVTFATLTQLHPQTVITGNILGFCWSGHVRRAIEDLSFPDTKEYIVAIDNELSMCIFSVSKEEGKKGPGSCKVLLSSLIGKQIFSQEDQGRLSSLEIIDATYDDGVCYHEILLLVNSKEVVQIGTKADGEPLINLQIPLPTTCDPWEVNKIICSKVKDSLVFLISNVGIFFKDIISLVRGVVLKSLKLVAEESYSRTEQFEDFFLQGATSPTSTLRLCDISTDLRYAVFCDQDGVLHLVTFDINSIETLEEAYSEVPVTENAKKNSIHEYMTVQYDMEISNMVWKNELNDFHKELISTEFVSNEGVVPSHSHFGVADSGMEESGVLLVDHEILQLPEWTKGCRVEDILVGNGTALITVCPPLDQVSSGEEATDPSVFFLLKFDMNSKNFVAQSIPKTSVIAKPKGSFFPHCILTQEAMYVPTFDATQEELVSSIIQYTGIAEAEAICRTNEWSQFSIPLHSLEVGLQHRQVDTISFFLRTKDKAFSRYWGGASQGNAPVDASSEGPSSEFVGSPSSYSSMKSVFIKSSLESTSIDPDELHEAVEMLVKAIHQNSKGKHKKNFFETLLRLTIDFVTSLIVDGTEVLENIVPKALSLAEEEASSNQTFVLLADIPESLRYLAECLVDIRQFVGDIPEFYSVQEEQDNGDIDMVDGAEEHLIPLKDHMETEISAGRITHLQRYLLKNQPKGDREFAFSFESITEFGLNFALRKLTKRNLEDAVLILKNLGLDHKAILRRLFEVTLDRGLRNFLLGHFSQEPYNQMLSEDEWKDVEYLDKVEKWYPRNVHSQSCIMDSWETLKTSFHDRDDIEATDAACQKLSSLISRSEQEAISTGLYSELTFSWIKKWDEKSKEMVLLDAAFQSNNLENLKELAPSEVLWEYLIEHNDEDRILDWIRTSAQGAGRLKENYPPFDPNFIEKCDNATEKLQNGIYRELLRHGIYTKYMERNFNKTLKLMTEDNLLLKKSDETYTISPIFATQFIVYCVKNNLRELLFIYMDFHGLYPTNASLEECGLDVNSYPWFKMMIGFRNYSNDKKQILEMNLATAENILNLSGNDLKHQLCQTKPLTVLATILTSSLELNRVFNNDMTSNLGFDGQTLMNSLKQYPTLYAAIFNEDDSSGERTVSAIQLLQDNTDIDAKRLFNWRLQDSSSEGIPTQCVPNFSSKELVEQFGVRVDMSYVYYLKQRRPVYAYIVFIRSLPNEPEEREQRLSEACYEACEIATADFANNPVASACICFLYLLGMDTLALKVEVESANFVLKHWEKRDDELYSADEKLKKFIVASLRGKENDRAVFLGMLEECVEAGLRTKNIEWSSFEAILSYRIAVQFAQVSNLTPSTKIIEETIKDGCWFHTIVYIQMYQLKPSEIIPALEKSMTNTVLLDHMCAIVKNAKEMRKTVEEPMETDQRPKQVKKGRHAVKSAALEKDFRAQFYFNLNKGATERTDLVSPTRSVSPSLNENRRRREQGLGGVSSGSSESIDEKPVEKPPIKIGEIQPLDDILDIALECEETGFPSRVLLRYALNYSQPFLTVLAACYKDSSPLNCLSVWLISNIETFKRKTVFKNVSDLTRADWTVQMMLELVSDLLFGEAKAIVIIAQGFKIFMKENLLYHFFLFIESFAAKECDDVCSQHLKAFTARLVKEKVGEEHFIEQFFHQMIPIKVLIAFQSKFFKRKLLQYFIDSDLGKFQSPNRASYIRLAMVCEISKETAILPDYLKLASEMKDLANKEENRIFDHLISNEHLEKAAKLAASLDLPSWKVAYSQETTELARMKETGLWLSCEARFDFWMKSNERLHKCRCSHSVAGSFFESQGVIEEDLPFSERALLLAMANDWFRESKEALDGSEKEKSELEAKLKELEKKLWLLKLNAEVEKLDKDSIAGPEDPSLARTIQLCNAKIFEFLSEKRNKERFSDFHDSSQTNLLISEEPSGNEMEGNSADWSQRENDAFEVMIGQLIDDCEIDQAQRVSMLFGRTTRDLYYILSAIALAQGTKQVENLEEDIKRLLAKTPKRSLSLSSSYETVVSSSRGVSTVESTASPGLVISDWVIIEEVQNAIEKLMSTCTRGRKCCERILICFKISKMLSISYKEIVSWDPFRVLRLLIYSDMDQQRQICRQYIKTFDLKDEEVAAFIAKIVIRVIKSKANIELSTLTVQEFTDTTKLNSNEITRLMQLVQQPSSLGTFLLEEAKGMAATVHGETDVNKTQVELLIRAHDSFTLSCNMEGISEVLRTARVCTLQLVENKAYSLMVRILTGIGRFKEMSYVFEALAEAHHFELLFRKDIDKEAQLKSALLEYIKTNHPNDTEKMDMLSMRFGMHREVGEQLEETGEKQILALSSKFSGSLKDLESELKSVMQTFSYAADNFRKVNCLRQFARCKRVARLAELQIRLLPTGKKVIGLRNESLKKFLTNHEDFYEALIIADGYNSTSTSIWVDPLFERVVQKGEMNYLKQYLSLYQLTGSLVSDIVARFRSERTTSSMGENLRKILLNLKDVKLRYKLAHDLSFNDIVNALLKGPQGAFLKDSLFIH